MFGMDVEQNGEGLESFSEPNRLKGGVINFRKGHDHN
jgi:hypothetical protein